MFGRQNSLLTGRLRHCSRSTHVQVTHAALMLPLYLRLGTVLLLMLGAAGVRAQDEYYPSHLRPQGVVRSCVPLRILDAPSSIYIRAVVDSTLPDSTVEAVLYCMQVRAVLDSAVIPVVTAPGRVGTRIPVQIQSRVDSTVILVPTVDASIDPTAVYQLVLPMKADTVTIDSTLTCEPWNGRYGGVIDVQARDVIIFDGGRIDASARGFRGGLRSANGGSCSLTQACDPPSSGRTAEKGEAFVVRDTLCWSGHTSWASGGGGGDAHNAGGGGGGNGGSGGRGGDQWSCGLPLGMHGMPGCAIIDTTVDRVVFGGGGGGGHQNNGVGTDGAAGGGIVILHAQRIEGDTIDVTVDGESNARVAANDGGGGGGGGGTIVLDACVISAPLQASVRGGRGGNCGGGHGPGGGGGGGRVLVEPSLLQNAGSSLYIDRQGGMSGLNGGPTSTFNAMPGEPGIIIPLCARVVLHRLSSSREIAIGETDTISIESRDVTSLCPVRITHNITIIGSSLLPLIDSMEYDSLIDVRIDRPAVDTAIITATLPSTVSVKIPMLGLLHQDTVSLLRHTSAVVFSDSIPSCAWAPEEYSVVTRACGLPIRVVREWSPLRISLYSSYDDLRVAIEHASSEPVTITISSMQGRTLLSQLCSSFQRSGEQQWRGEVRIPIDHLSNGAYLVTAQTQQQVVSTLLHISQN